MNSKIQFYISTCPNDTFVSYGLINQKVNLDNFKIEPHYFDIRQLNEIALEGKADIIKASSAILPQVCHLYNVLSSGAALGFNCGPLLIAKSKDIELSSSTKIAIPGKNTTAFKLFKRYYGDSFEFVEMLFSDIEEAIVGGFIDAGLIIHENRFTFQNKGLVELTDLGQKWHSETSLPIPLGCFLIHKKWDLKSQLFLDNALTESVLYAHDQRDDAMKFVMQFAQTMEYSIAKKHISLYVNDETKRISEQGKLAIMKLINEESFKNNCTFVR